MPSVTYRVVPHLQLALSIEQSCQELTPIQNGIAVLVYVNMSPSNIVGSPKYQICLARDPFHLLSLPLSWSKARCRDLLSEIRSKYDESEEMSGQESLLRASARDMERWERHKRGDIVIGGEEGEDNQDDGWGEGLVDEDWEEARRRNAGVKALVSVKSTLDVVHCVALIIIKHPSMCLAFLSGYVNMKSVNIIERVLIDGLPMRLLPRRHYVRTSMRASRDCAMRLWHRSR